MKKIGDMIKITGDVLGDTVEKGVSGTSNLLSHIAKKKDHGDLSKGIKKGGKIIGKGASLTTKLTFSLTGEAVNKGVEVGKKTAKYVKKNIVKEETKLYGNSKNFYKNKYVDADYKIIDK
ncbi:hypothetical protein [Clostridium oceanicum]|uniref:Pre-toxin TG domain-containing protein n=1 Tax=Clostridium oceanicum TaxID=1543 RepID=A0ABN1JHE6_9CLOT